MRQVETLDFFAWIYVSNELLDHRILTNSDLLMDEQSKEIRAIKMRNELAAHDECDAPIIFKKAHFGK